MDDEAGPKLSRRQFLRNATVMGAGVAVGAVLATGATFALLPLWSPKQAVLEASEPPSPILVKTDTGNRYAALADLAGAAPAFVVALWHDRPVLLMKLDQAILRASTKSRGYNTAQHAIQHPTEAENAIIAYDAKCTHLGCTVGFNVDLGASKDVPDYDGNGQNDGRVLCPCHQAQFDVYDLAKNAPGTPGPRPLDVIQIKIGTWTDDDTVKPDTVDVAILGLGRIHQDKYKAADRQGNGAGFALAPTP